MTDLANLRTHFKGLDEDFINRDKITDDVYAYDSSDVLVQTTFELPIIIECAGSTVHYEFTSNQGDISFGVEFQSERGEELGIEEPRRVNFAEQPLRGAFDVSQRGVVFFLWDNCYDWSGEKRVSYVVRIEQPIFSQSDKRRSSRSIAMLNKTTPILDGLHEKYRKAAENFSYNQSYLYVLNSRMNVLQQNLADRMYERSELDATAAMANENIFGNEVLTTLFGIRCLDSDTLVHLLQFMDPSVASNVCKHWRSLVAHIQSPMHGLVLFSAVLQQERADLQLEDAGDNADNNGVDGGDNGVDDKERGIEKRKQGTQKEEKGAKRWQEGTKVPRVEVDAILEKLKVNKSKGEFYEDDLNKVEKELSGQPVISSSADSDAFVAAAVAANNNGSSTGADGGKTINDNDNSSGKLEDGALVSAGATAAVKNGYDPREDTIDPECAAFEATGKFDELMTARVDEFLTFLCVPMLQLLPQEYMDNLVDELAEILDNYVLDFMADKFVKSEDELDAHLVDYLQRREVMWDMEDHRDDIVEYFASERFQQQLREMNEKQQHQQHQQDEKQDDEQQQQQQQQQGLLSSKNIAMLHQYGRQARARAKSHRQERRKAQQLAKKKATKAAAVAAVGGSSLGMSTLPTVEEEEEEEEEADAENSSSRTRSSSDNDRSGKIVGGAQHA